MPQTDDDQRRVFNITADTESVTGEKPPTKYNSTTIDERFYASTSRRIPKPYCETLMHFVKAYVGTGIFAMGDAYKNSGLLLGPALLIFFGLLNLFCQHKLVECAKRVAEKEPIEVRPNFSETVEYTFIDGPVRLQKYARLVGHLTNYFIYGTELSFCCVYYLFVANHLVEVTDANGYNINIQYMFLIIFIPMWLAVILLSSLKILVPLSIIANFLLWIGICIIFYYTSQDLVPISERPLFTDHLERIPLSLGTALFAFEGITFVLPLQNEMGNPRLFTKPFGILNMGFFIVLLLYGSVGFMSYYKYGEDVKGSVFLNLPTKEILSQSVKGVMAVATAATYTLHNYVAFEVTYPKFYARYGPFKHPNFVICIYKTVPVIISYLLANVVPFLGLFISLIGCVFGAVLALIMPPFLELCSFDRIPKISTIIIDILIIILGVCGMILGIIVSLYFIVMAFIESNKQ